MLTHALAVSCERGDFYSNFSEFLSDSNIRLNDDERGTHIFKTSKVLKTFLRFQNSAQPESSLRASSDLEGENWYHRYNSLDLSIIWIKNTIESEQETSLKSMNIIEMSNYMINWYTMYGSDEFSFKIIENGFAKKANVFMISVKFLLFVIFFCLTVVPYVILLRDLEHY